MDFDADFVMRLHMIRCVTSEHVQRPIMCKVRQWIAIRTTLCLRYRLDTLKSSHRSGLKHLCDLGQKKCHWRQLSRDERSKKSEAFVSKDKGLWGRNQIMNHLLVYIYIHQNLNKRTQYLLHYSSCENMHFTYLTLQILFSQYCTLILKLVLRSKVIYRCWFKHDF